MYTIPEEVARSRNIVPIKDRGDHMVIAVADPLDVTSMDDMKVMVGKPVKPVIALEEEIEAALNQVYGEVDEVSGVIEELTEDDVDLVSDQSADLGDDVEEMVDQTPVIKLVNMIILEAIQNNASDIHLEPFEHRFVVRMRLDGVLKELNPPPQELQSAVTSRVKVMADMDIAETRMPQDGRIRVQISGKELDFRVSTLPTVFGESVVLRVLSQDDIDLETGALGMLPEQEDSYRDIIERPNGIMLVTGPTGSGKTTTLYAGINHINEPTDKIITMEDPVEYEIPGLIQCQVHEEVGMTFANGLRAILRQDPDICLVGEIRDIETAQTAIQASLTGHLVLSTVHTNDAAGAITRMIDMGIKPFLLTATIQGVLGQRLVRILCEHCQVEYEPDPTDIRAIGEDPREWRDHTFYRGEGCDRCGGTGFDGRTGIFELLVISEEVQKLILDGNSASDIENHAVENGMVTMRQHGWQKAVEGITTLEEVLRVAPVEGDLSVDVSELDVDEEVAGYL